MPFPAPVRAAGSDTVCRAVEARAPAGSDAPSGVAPLRSSDLSEAIERMVAKSASFTLPLTASDSIASVPLHSKASARRPDAVKVAEVPS